MTIITKTLTEKKNDKLILPLVENDQLASASPPNQDPEAQTPSSARLVLLNARARRVTTITTLTLLLTSLAIVGIGIIGGTYLYRQYLRAQIFKGWCNIPYDEEKAAMFIGTKIDDEDHKMDDSKLFKPLDDVENFQTIVSNYFQEQFELDLENEKFEKIDVPDFRDGRSGRFIHDFNTNKTCIIDVSEKRCFVMPLNRDRVLPPRSMFDLIQKMWDGYYKVNTTVVRENMRVVLPPITDMSEIGDYIERECYGMLIYKLEKDDSKVWKRSADLENNAKFAQFSGHGIQEYDITNMEEVNNYEKVKH